MHNFKFRKLRLFLGKWTGNVRGEKKTFLFYCSLGKSLPWLNKTLHQVNISCIILHNAQSTWALEAGQLQPELLASSCGNPFCNFLKILKLLNRFCNKSGLWWVLSHHPILSAFIINSLNFYFTCMVNLWGNNCVSHLFFATIAFCNFPGHERINIA